MTQQQDWVPQDVDTSVPNVARTYDFLLGGAHNFAVDRAFAEQVEKALPGSRHMARVNRAFMARAVRAMVADGVRQFLDVGAGIPTVGNVHEIAQAAVPECRVAYVDKDPIAVAHSELLLMGDDRAVAAQADLRDVASVLDAPAVRGLLDFEEPIGVLMLLVLHWVPDDADPHRLLAGYIDRLAPGSMVAISHVTETDESTGTVEEMRGLVKRSQARDSLTYRGYDEVVGLFAGLDLVEPGVVGAGLWRPDGPGAVADDPEANTVIYAGVGRKTG
ncbi:SAM-dependent methyltransferase [Actinokineospora guangxiensis]|uniref:SAM-dependent methyltransferase n=1 Tax=Actinokineospora guangxiensis TaxID=1490288 RepID=A0ABW0ERN6_9PSEU